MRFKLTISLYSIDLTYIIIRAARVYCQNLFKMNLSRSVARKSKFVNKSFNDVFLTEFNHLIRHI